MKVLRPKSILQLILVGFSVAMLPLILALATAEIYVKRLTREGQTTVLEATQTVQSSRMLVELITAMERNAGQFAVLRDPKLYEVYLARREEFRASLNELKQLNLNDRQRQQVQELSSRESDLHRNLVRAAKEQRNLEASVRGFPALSALARAILAEGGHTIAQDIDSMQRDAERAQRVLISQSAALIPAAFLLSALFIVLIARPLRQIDQAIRLLGTGEFSTKIDVKGPQDLEELGRRLDWLRTRLLELENEKVSFLRHISHELKTPLTTIREGSELLTEQVVGTLNDEQTEIAQLLRDNGLQLQKLIENLLNFNVSQVPTPFVDQRPVRLDRVIEAVVQEHKLISRARNVAIDTELSPTTVIGDQEKLRTVMDNLVSNAVKYSPCGGRVTVKLTRFEATTVIDVIDQGPGIDPSEREKIFEAFYQGRAVYKGHVKGSGLGLSITQKYVRSHKGTIHVVEGGKGGHFRLSLPAEGTEH